MTTPDDERRHQGAIQDRRDVDRWLILGLLLFALTLMIVATTVGTLIVRQMDRTVDRVDQQSGKLAQTVDRLDRQGIQIRHVEREDRKSARGAAFRQCVRGMTDRAFAHSRVGRPDARLLEKWWMLPILNCKPNLNGRGAKTLSRKSQRRYVRRWERHRLSHAEVGICPNSIIGSQVKPNKC